MSNGRLRRQGSADLHGLLQRKLAQSLDTEEVQEALRDCVADVVAGGNGKAVDKERLLRALEERDVMSEVLQRTVQSYSADKSTSKPKGQSLSALQLYVGTL